MLFIRKDGHTGTEENKGKKVYGKRKAENRLKMASQAFYAEYGKEPEKRRG